MTEIAKAIVTMEMIKNLRLNKTLRTSTIDGFTAGLLFPSGCGVSSGLAIRGDWGAFIGIVDYLETLRQGSIAFRFIRQPFGRLRSTPTSEYLLESDDVIAHTDCDHT